MERAAQLPARRAGHRDLQQRGRHRARGDVAQALGAGVGDDDRGADGVGEVQAAGVVGERDGRPGDERGEHGQAGGGQGPDVRGAGRVHDLVDEVRLRRRARDQDREARGGDRGRGGTEPHRRVAPRRARRPGHEQGEPPAGRPAVRRCRRRGSAASPTEPTEPTEPPGRRTGRGAGRRDRVSASAYAAVRDPQRRRPPLQRDTDRREQVQRPVDVVGGVGRRGHPVRRNGAGELPRCTTRVAMPASSPRCATGHGDCENEVNTSITS